MNFVIQFCNFSTKFLKISYFVENFEIKVKKFDFL